MKRLLVVASLALAALLLPAAARAQTTNTLTVTANVLEACTISPATLAFGAYSAAVLDVSTDITVTCNQGASFWIGLDAGNNGPSGAFGTTRQMTNGADVLAYELYRDSGHTAVWDDTNGGLPDVIAPSTGALAVPVYGRVPAGQVVAVDDYDDAVTMTVHF